jgi:hypothetical protein
VSQRLYFSEPSCLLPKLTQLTNLEQKAEFAEIGCIFSHDVTRNTQAHGRGLTLQLAITLAAPFFHRAQFSNLSRIDVVDAGLAVVSGMVISQYQSQDIEELFFHYH